MRRAAPLGAVLLVLVAFVTVQLSFGRFTRNDEIVLKAPGRELVATGFWRNPEAEGHRNLVPPVEEVWMAHVPLHPFLFALWIKLVGFGFFQNVLFDTLVHCALVLLVFALARLRGPELSPWVASAAALVTVVVFNPGRPEELISCFGLASYLILRGGTLTPWRLVAAGLGVGLCAATHPVGTVLYAALCSVAVIAIPGALPLRLQRVGVLAGLALLVVGGSVLPILWRHPTALHQFFAHVGQQMNPSYGEDLRIAWRDGRSYLFLIFGASMAGAVELIRARSRPARLDWLERYGVGLGFALLIAARLARHPYYFWSAPPVLVPATVVTVARLWEQRTRRAAYALGFCVVVLGCLAALDFFKETLNTALLPKDQRPEVNASAVRRIVPLHTRVAAGELWSELGNDYRFRSPNHDPLPLDKLDYVLLWASGRHRAGECAPVNGDASYFAKHFRVIYDNLPRERTTLFGVPVSSGYWGFGPRIYANIDHLAEHYPTP